MHKVNIDGTPAVATFALHKTFERDCWWGKWASAEAFNERFDESTGEPLRDIRKKLPTATATSNFGPESGTQGSGLQNICADWARP